MINKYTDPIITNYRFDNSGSKITVPVTESLKITNGIIFLKEIPDKRNGTTISSFSEVQKPEDLDSENKFYVDYNTGVVYFDSKLNGTKVNVEYSGIGIVYYPASRIYLEVDENHEIIRTLSDIEGQLSSLTNLKNQQERLKQEIEERNGDLNKTIEEAKKIDLSGSVDKANQAKTDLEGTTRKANIADANLRTDIEFAKGAKIDLKKQEEQSKAEIQKSVNLANQAIIDVDDILEASNDKISDVKEANAKANGKITEINSKIVEVKATEQKLTTTKNEITTSLSDYDKKSAEIKSSSNDLELKNNELKSTIVRANESKIKLDESKTSADELNKNLLSNKNELATLDNSLKAENEKATKNISDLDIKSASGKQIVNDLNSATLKSETAKTNLDESNDKAIQTNTDLRATTQTANETKTSLEQLKNESSTLSNELSEGNTTANSNIELLKSENQSAKTNITGLQTENQNALSKQETLSTETAKANEAIERIAELITSSTDLKNKLEQIVASGDLDKYITDPKLREILTDYATKDDLSKIDVTSQLVDYAKKADLEKIDITSQLKLENNTFEIIIEKEDFNNIQSEPNKIKIVSLVKTKRFGVPKNMPDDVGSYIITRSTLATPNIQYAVSLKNRKTYQRTVTDEWFDTRTNKLHPTNYGKWKEYGIQNANMADLELKADKSSIPTSLSQLTDDETHRLVTDEEKNKWNNPPNPDLTDYAKKADLDTKADKTELPSALSQLANDTNFKTETEIQEMIANSSKLKKEVTTSLPSTGKDDVIYLVKDTNGKDNNNYLEYLWINGKWELIGSTQVDLSGYAKKKEILDKMNDLLNELFLVEPNAFPFFDFLKNPSKVNGDWNTTPFSNGVRFYHSKGAKNSPNGDGVYIVFTSFEVIREDEVDWFTWTSSENFIPLTVAYHLESGNIYMRNFTIDKEPEDVSFEPGTLECGVVPTSCTPWKEITKDFATKNDITKALTNTAKLQDLDLKLNKTDLTPFTQQELEEAFK